MDGVQKFEGFVECIEGSLATVRLYDLMDRSNPVEWAEISLDEFIGPVEKGSFFDWTIKWDESRIVVREDRWTQRELDDAKRKAVELLNNMYRCENTDCGSCIACFERAGDCQGIQ